MTNPTLERAARALAKMDGWDWDAMGKASNPILPEFQDDYLLQARAVLMAVLPTLERWNIEGEEGSMLGWCQYPGPDGEFVSYADLEAILNDEEGE